MVNGRLSVYKGRDRKFRQLPNEFRPEKVTYSHKAKLYFETEMLF